MKEQCKSFRKYKAIREPRCGCRCCWDLFFSRHPLWVSFDLKVLAADPEKLEHLRGTVYVKELKEFVKRYGEK